MKQRSEEVISGRAAISVGDPGTAVPDGWQRVLLTDVARMESGHTPSRNHPEYWNGDVPWVGIVDARVNHGRVIQETLQTVTEKGLANSAARWLPAQTVCLSRTASVGYVIMLGRPMATSQDFVNWICHKALEPKFLMYALLAEGERLKSFGKGTSSTHTTIYFPEALAFHIDIPPVVEQRRIVAKIEALMAQVSTTRARLAKVPLILERFRQSVLAAACSGRLTSRDWDPDDVDALPEGWRLAQVEELLPPGGIFDGPFGSSLKSSDYTSSGVRVIRLENLGHLRFFAQKCTYVSQEKYQTLSRHAVGEGDIVFGSFVDGSVRVCLIPKLDTFAIAKADCFCLRPDPQLVESEYLVFQLATNRTRDLLVGEIHGATRPRVNTKQLREVSIPICSLEEQRAVVASVRSLFALADTIERRVAVAIARTDKVPQAILAKAFRGELVPTEAELARAEGRDYEPASVLLERIRKERAAAGPTAGRERKKAAPEKAPAKEKRTTLR